MMSSLIFCFTMFQRDCEPPCFVDELRLFLKNSLHTTFNEPYRLCQENEKVPSKSF